MRSLFRLGLLLALSPLARAEAPPRDLLVDTQASSVTYRLVHKLHRFDGVSRSVAGRARIADSGAAQVMVRIPVVSFDSHNVNRDEHMKETVEAARYPDVELKALGGGLAPPASMPATVQRTMKAQITLHGVQQQLDIPVAVTFESPTRMRARASFTVSVDSFKIERPSLLFVKIDDAMQIDADVVFAQP